MGINESNVLDEKEAAYSLKLGVQTLRNWRCARRGPPYLKIGRCVRYRIEDIEHYKWKKRVDPEK